MSTAELVSLLLANSPRAVEGTMSAPTQTRLIRSLFFHRSATATRQTTLRHRAIYVKLLTTTGNNEKR